MTTPPPHPKLVDRPWVRSLALWAGLLVPQVAEYGPCLFGSKVLLPLDLLAAPGVYLPQSPEYSGVNPGNQINLDKVLWYEPARRFAAVELLAGRYPTWQPYHHGGTPFFVPLLSPFTLLYMAVPDPGTLVWAQLLKTVVAGLGAFLFFRHGLAVGFWPACVGAWVFPLCGFMVFWQGHYLSDAAAWLPWAVFATDLAVRRPGGCGGPLLGLSISCSALTGAVDVTASTLLVSGLYAIHRQASDRGWSLRRAAAPAAAVVTGWAAGLLIGTLALVPYAEFARTGARVEERASGKEERPPVGLTALPQAVLPFCHGTHERRDVPAYATSLVLPESAATAYAGLLAALVAFPLAIASLRYRGRALFWAGVAVIGMSWQLDLPGFVSFWRIPGVNLYSHNRDTILTAFAVAAGTVLGLEACTTGLKWRSAFWCPVGVVIVLCMWSLHNTVISPDPIRTNLAEVLKRPGGARSEVGKAWQAADDRYSQLSLWGATVCGAGIGWWALAVWRFGSSPGAARVLGGAILAEVLVTGWGYNAQSDRRLYYPPVPVLERLRTAPSGRIIGIGCFPPSLPFVHHLPDVRGGEGVDPKRYVELLERAADTRYKSPDYARTLGFVPRIGVAADGGIKLPPLLDLLGVRYLVLAGRPAPTVRARDQEGGYFVLENPAALPLAFVPARTVPAPGREELLGALGSEEFNPRETAYIEGLDAPGGTCHGAAQVEVSAPGEFRLRVESDAPGVVVVATGWYSGWSAEVDGVPTEVRRANHALIAVGVPGGTSAVTLRYQSRGLGIALRLACLGGVVLVLWSAVAAVRRRGAEPTVRPSPLRPNEPVPDEG